MKYLFTALLLGLAGTAQAQATATTQPSSSRPRVLVQPKQEWYAKAKRLQGELAPLKDKPAGPELVKEYAALQRKLFPTVPYSPGDEGPAPASTLAAQLSKWMQDVQAGKFDNRFPIIHVP